MKELHEIIAKNISELRTDGKMTQTQLAQKLNYSDKAVSKWERGESLPDIVVLKQIADIFSVSVDYLLEEKHTVTLSEAAKKKKLVKRNRLVITIVLSSLIWLIAAVAFLIILFTGSPFPAWLVYIYAMPISALVIQIFNALWYKKRWMDITLGSVIVWSTLLSVYLTQLLIFSINFWPTFALGVPLEVIVVFLALFTPKSRIPKTDKIKKEEEVTD
ncbi:MAG: helix-turn-helix transcriptional regulator [Clostridia bacterium]|nr:helix-turn-helix transcriptional regulator [Clostridia bacterium]